MKKKIEENSLLGFVIFVDSFKKHEKNWEIFRKNSKKIRKIKKIQTVLLI